MKVFFCAGEPSSDLHGANVIKALKRLEPGVECVGLGGHRMEQAGMTLRFDLAQSALLGIVEVVRSIGMIRRLYFDTAAFFKRERPDVVVLIDYPGFNLMLASRARKLDIPVIYYISPQIWAWRRNRIRTIQRTVRKMLVILPFEQAIYEEAGVPCAYVGHPLLDQIEQHQYADDLTGGLVIGVLPGSRRQEIRRILPVMVEVARGIRERYPDARFITPCVSDEHAALIRSIAGDFPLHVVTGRTYEVLKAARFCLVASGTATLECSLFKVPQVVLYRASPITVWVLRKFVGNRIKAISLVNILAGRHIVPEFIQETATCENILPHALELISDSERRRIMIAEFDAIRSMLKSGAAQSVAREILETARVAGGEGS